LPAAGLFLDATTNTNSAQLNPSRPAGHAIPQPLWCPKMPCYYQMPANTRHFSPLQNVQTGSEAHPASHLMGVCGSFPTIKCPGLRLTTHLHPVLGLKNVWSYKSTPPRMPCRACKGQLYVYLAPRENEDRKFPSRQVPVPNYTASCPRTPHFLAST
jgi:hypothetical protein